jgi:hypothetical protein
MKDFILWLFCLCGVHFRYLKTYSNEHNDYFTCLTPTCGHEWRVKR